MGSRLTKLQMSLLSDFEECGPASVYELGERMATLNVLFRAGLVERHPKSVALAVDKYTAFQITPLGREYLNGTR